jgi:quercetin dioxygenase-like cupin family protein
MKRTMGSTVVCVLVALSASTTLTAQLAPTCAENSPERGGGIGCSVVESKVLPDGLQGPVFWHIDRFDSAETARAAAGPASVALDSAGTWWLMTIERDLSNHHGGRHTAGVGPLPLPTASRYAMQVLSVAWTQGLYSLVHRHSGVEAFYVIDGEQCMQTPERATTVRRGETITLPTGVTMRVTATGSGIRRALAVIVHDAAQPPTMRMDEASAPALASCK